MFSIFKRDMSANLFKVFLGVALLLVSLDARSQYMHRRDEVKETIIQNITDETIQRQVDASVNSIFGERSKALKDALRLLENASTSEEFAGDAWNHLFQDTTTQAAADLRALADETETAIGEIENATDALVALPEALRQLAGQQVGLLRGLWRSNPAEIRDILVIFKREYDESHDSMADRRDFLRSQFRSIESDAKSHRDGILKAGETMIKAVNAGNQALKQYLDNELDEDVEPSDVDNRVSRFVSEMEEALEDFIVDVDDDLDRLDRIFSRERASIVMLHESRGRIQEMVDEQNPPIATAAFDESDDEMNLVHTGRPAGDIRDLADFVPAAMDRVEVHLESFESGFVKFIEAFEGLFVDPVSAETADEFLYTAAWQSFASSVQRLALVSYLGDLRNKTDNNWSASLSALPEEARDDIEDILDDESDRLLDAIQTALEVSNRLQILIGLSARQALRSQLQG